MGRLSGLDHIGVKRPDDVTTRLGDQDDDVRSVAAACLTPIAQQIVERLPEELSAVMAVLWSCLADMKDDLGSSVGAVMDLLGEPLRDFLLGAD